MFMRRYTARSPAIPSSPDAEERLNTISHAAGILLGIAATLALAIRAIASGDIWRIVTYPVFGLTAILLYTASTVYHGQGDPGIKAKLKVFDHVSIYYLIAGTYTPITIVGMGGVWGWTIFGTVWGLALAGTLFKLLFTGRFPVISTVLYIAMGWIAVIAVVPLIRSLPVAVLAWLLAGGLFYTTGVVFYAWRRLPFNHGIWHFFVLFGTACHFVAVMLL